MAYPKFLYAGRALQFILAIGIISTLVWSNKNPGYWLETSRRSIAAYVTAIVTLLVTLGLAALQFKSHVFSAIWKALPADILCALLWIVSAAQLARKPEEDTVARIFWEEDPDMWQFAPPKGPWYGGLTMCIIQFVLFVITAFVMFRTTKRG